MTAFAPDLAGAVVSPSPNHGERRNGRTPDLLLLHYTGMASGKAALDWLRNPDSGVSSHYLVCEDGAVHQLVPEARRAWHAGKSHWAGDSDINSCSIGIEIAHPGHDGGNPDYDDAQIAAVTALCRDCVERWAIRAERVLGHSDVAPQRKQDPGERFPWRRLHRDGIGHFVDPMPIRAGGFFQRGDCGQPVEALQSMLALYGYHIDVNGRFDDVSSAAVTAFQRHFRPERVDGVADVSTIETLHRLLSALPHLS